MWTIAIGNAFDGLELVGLFEAPEDASEHAEQEYGETEWTVVKINP